MTPTHAAVLSSEIFFIHKESPESDAKNGKKEVKVIYMLTIISRLKQ